MKENKKKSLLPKSTLIIRLIAGMYLIYLAYELFMGLWEVGSEGAPKGISIVAVIIFIICGLLLTITSGKSFLKGEFVGGIMDQPIEENTDIK